jgi:adenylate cyclase
MDADRTATVLIADPSTDARRHEDCRKAVTRAVISAADSTGGLLVSNRGGTLILRFATADAAASAASKIHAALDALPDVGGTRPGIQIGFHTGPIANAADSLPDDTLNLALKLAAKAQDGQTVTSQQTAERLNPAFRGFSRSLLSLQDETRLCEIASWHQKGVRPEGWAAMAVLRLSYRDQLVVCSREKETIVIGREGDCDLVVAERRVASRHHCTVRHRSGEFTLHDHSRNGTYLKAGTEGETELKRTGALLPEKGAIVIGRSREGSPEVVEFCYALVT